MELQLRIIHDPHAELAKQRVRVFGKSGGSVGRALDNHWVLPDPGWHLSGHHCEIFYSQGQFQVRDTSRNGVFLNGSQQALGLGRSARVADGDSLQLATYVMRVRLSSHREVPQKAPANRVVAEDVQEADDVTETTGHKEITGQHAVADQHKAPTPAQDPALRDSATRGSAEVTGEHLIQVVHATTDIPAGVPSAPTTVAEPGGLPEDLTRTRTLGDESAPAPARPVIHVDRSRLQAEGHLPPAKAERPIGNQFRHIKRPLIKNALGKGVEAVPDGHLAMVTSSLPSEGKTFNSIGLAFSIAREKDLQVVLVDADVAKQNVSRIFSVEGEPGLLNALADESLDVETLILPTDVPGLSILPAGQYEEDVATELLASARTDEIAESIGTRSKNRIALLDSTPLLLTNESRVLASLMGQILLVVRAGETPRQAVQEAIGYVDEDKPLGIVLNQSKAQRPRSYYGYGS